MPFCVATEQVKKSKSLSTSWHGLRAVRCRQGLRSSMRTDVERSLVTIVARVRCRGWFLVPVLRARVALAPEILYLAPMLIVTKREPQKTKQAKTLKSSTFTRRAQQHHHDRWWWFSRGRGSCLLALTIASCSSAVFR